MSDLRHVGEPPPPPAGTVWTAERDRKGRGGRYHTDPGCWALIAPKRRREWGSAVWAAAADWTACPYCAVPRPPCCESGSHRIQTLPRLAPAEMPEWEQELLAQEGALPTVMEEPGAPTDDIAAWFGEE